MKKHTRFHTDVKMPIVAGMEFCYSEGKTKNNKMRIIGHEVVRLYYDTHAKDCCIGQAVISRVLSI